MKDILQLKTKEQIDLVTDPFVLSIIALIKDQPASREWIAEEMEEKQELINTYICEMCEHGLMEKIKKDGQEMYIAAAKSFHTDKNAIGSGSIYWISGILNHVENEIQDLFKLIDDRDRDKFLSELGFEDMSFFQSNLTLTKSQVEKLKSFLEELGNEAEDSAADAEKESYTMLHFFYPDVNALKKKWREREQTE